MKKAPVIKNNICNVYILRIVDLNYSFFIPMTATTPASSAGAPEIPPAIFHVGVGTARVIGATTGAVVDLQKNNDPRCEVLLGMFYEAMDSWQECKEPLTRIKAMCDETDRFRLQLGMLRASGVNVSEAYTKIDTLARTHATVFLNLGLRGKDFSLPEKKEILACVEKMGANTTFARARL
jgi:hypothetical protein